MPKVSFLVDSKKISRVLYSYPSSSSVVFSLTYQKFNEIDLNHEQIFFSFETFVVLVSPVGFLCRWKKRIRNETRQKVNIETCLDRSSLEEEEGRKTVHLDGISSLIGSRGILQSPFEFLQVILRENANQPEKRIVAL